MQSRVSQVIVPRGDSSSDPPPPLALPARRAVNWRSVGIGLLLSGIVAGLAPVNDFVITNGFLIGSYLPPVLVLAVFVLVVLINAPLHRLRPRSVLSPGELAVILAMLLTACAVPGQGLMRELLPIPVAMFFHGASEAAFWQYFQTLELPSWLFPTGSFEDEARTSEVVRQFYGRTPAGEAIPWAAWVVPLAGWGVFFLGLFAVLLALSEVLRRQWALNERLAFPLAQLQLALIEPPEPGRRLNALFRTRGFWIAAGLVFFLHGMTGLNQYFPSIVPAVPLAWNLSGVFSEQPWSYLHPLVKTGTLYFTFIGITYFIQSRIAFSLWVIFLVQDLVSMQFQVFGRSIPMAAWHDQHLGAGVVLLLGMLWTGRHHWLLVLRQAIQGPKPNEPTGDFLSHRTAVIVMLAGLVVMITWLTIVGVGPLMTGLIIGFLIGGHLLIARVVAETGLPFMRIYAGLPQVFKPLPVDLFSGRDIFFAGAFTVTGPLASRESLLTFATHGLAVAGGSTALTRGGPAMLTTGSSPMLSETHHDRAARGGGGRLLSAMALALVVSLVISSASSLWCYYSYAAPLSANDGTGVLNLAGAVNWPHEYILTPVRQHGAGHYPDTPHNPWLHMGLGAAITAGLQVATWQWAAWPLVPVGYVVTGTWYIQVAWFSLFLGWAAKVLILRFGGATLFRQARPIFIGLIFGEAAAAGTWLVINLLLVWTGNDYHAIRILPT